MRYQYLGLSLEKVTLPEESYHTQSHRVDLMKIAY